MHLLEVRPQQGRNVSQFLLNKADQVHHWNADTVREFLACVPQTTAPANYRGDARRLLEWAAQKTVDGIAALPNLLGRIHALHQSNRPHPRDIDTLLLRLASDAIGGARLTDPQQLQVRQRFRRQVAQAATPDTTL